ncbi:PIN domain-containing protein [Candidatus Roizmanbacteria bacterium]|nr:PIN domain-containing protein [Candidatus Roizmanbacteria bacterium]
MKRYVLDANIFLRLLIKDEEKTFHHCLQLSEAIKTNKLKAVTTSVILAEIAWTLRSFYGLSRSEITEALYSIITISGLRIIDEYEHHLTLKLYALHGVKYVDALIASIKQVQQGEWIVVSYDKDFDRLDVVRQEPAEVLKLK